MEPGRECEVRPETAAAGKELTLSQIELVERIGWLINLRWLAFVGVAATILIARAAFICRLPWDKLLISAFAIPSYNAVCFVAWRRASRPGTENIERTSAILANIQILCDLLVLGALMHFSGGVENLFGFYFVFHTVIAGTLLSKRAAFAQATLAVVIFFSIIFGEYSEWLPHYSSPVGLEFPGLHSSTIVVFAAIWVMTSLLYVTVYFATSIASQLRKREDEVTSLSREIKQAADRLQIAYDKLAEIERAKSAYARNVAHELRSPLAAIESLLRVVADGLRGDVPDPVLNTISRARARTQELLALVHDLLALAAAKEAPRSAEWVVCNLRGLVDNVTGLLAAQAHARGITIRSDIAPDLPCVNGNLEQMEELLTNLVSNAVKYSREGGVVEVRLSESEESVVVEVADSGIGISEEDKRRIFEDFFRSSEARQFTSEGTGLGLSIAKTIVDSHGGTISFESGRGEGTRFTVRLPSGREQRAES